MTYFTRNAYTEVREYFVLQFTYEILLSVFVGSVYLTTIEDFCHIAQTTSENVTINRQAHVTT